MAGLAAPLRTTIGERASREAEKARSERYDYVVDPSDLYVVWDRLADLPAMSDGGILAFSIAEDASTVICRLKRHDAARLGSEDQPLTTEKILPLHDRRRETSDAAKG